MRPVVLIGYSDFGDISVERDALREVNAEIEYLGTLSSPEAREVMTRADAIMVGLQRVTSEMITSMDRCKIISRLGTGLDLIDVETATDCGIWVTNMPDAYVEEVATHTIAFILSCNRGIVPLVESTRSGIWDYHVMQPVSRLKGKILGLLGFGHIGKETAKLAQGIGMEVISHDPYVDPNVIKDHNVRSVDWKTLLQESDYLSLHVPLTEETEQIIDRHAFSLMKPRAYLINTGRGKLIDEEALLEAVQEGRIRGAALDVLDIEPPSQDNPLLEDKHIIVTPHAAFYSEEAVHNVRFRSAEAVIDVLQGRTPKNPANQPKRSDQVFGGSS
jgi:D-3-phosphoglycerate dehydrogenase